MAVMKARLVSKEHTGKTIGFDSTGIMEAYFEKHQGKLVTVEKVESVRDGILRLKFCRRPNKGAPFIWSLEDFHISDALRDKAAALNIKHYHIRNLKGDIPELELTPQDIWKQCNGRDSNGTKFYIKHTDLPAYNSHFAPNTPANKFTIKVTPDIYVQVGVSVTERITANCGIVAISGLTALETYTRVDVTTDLGIVKGAFQAGIGCQALLDKAGLLPSDTLVLIYDALKAEIKGNAHQKGIVVMSDASYHYASNRIGIWDFMHYIKDSEPESTFLTAAAKNPNHPDSRVIKCCSWVIKNAGSDLIKFDRHTNHVTKAEEKLHAA